MYKSDLYKGPQHNAVRNAVGWYYFTHQLLEVAGEDSTVFLDNIFVNNIAKLGVGRARYTTMLNEDGMIIDDVVVFRLEEDKYWVSTLYVSKMIKWFDAHKGESRIEYKDMTKSVDMYSVQGPKSRGLLNSFLVESVDEQKYFSIRDNKIDDVPVKISRSGFTGELGYEVYIASDKSELVETKLTECGKAFGAVRVTELEVMIMTLPSEKGYNLMCDIGGISPLEVDPNAKIDWSKEFIGKAALEKVAAEGPKRRLLGFTVEGENVHINARNWGGYGHAVMLDGEEVGRVSKFTYGYTVGTNIGYALVDLAKVKVGDKVSIHGYEATLTERIWYDAENQRPLGK